MTNSADAPETIGVGPEVVWAAVDREIIAVNLDEGHYIGLRGAARLIWECLAEGATRDRILARLLEHYDVSPEQAGADLDATLADLAGRKLLAPARND